MNREVTVSPQVEVGRESSGVAFEELCPLKPSSQNGSDNNSKDGNLEAYITLYFSSGKPLNNEAYNSVLTLIATGRHMSTLFKIICS